MVRFVFFGDTVIGFRCRLLNFDIVGIQGIKHRNDGGWDCIFSSAKALLAACPTIRINLSKWKMLLNQISTQLFVAQKTSVSSWMPLDSRLQLGIQNPALFMKCLGMRTLSK